MNNIDSPLLMPDFFSMFGSFILVLFLLGIVLYILKKLQMKSSVTNGGRQIQILEVMPTNNKQKIMLLKVGNQQFLVGVSGQNMNQLGHWTSSDSVSATSKEDHNAFVHRTAEDNLNIPKSKLAKAETTDHYSKKSSFMVPEKIDPDIKSNKYSHVSAIKQTENLLCFAKKIRGSLNQSIDRTQRAQ
jgi:flagellar protein FliO/FliZ